MRTQEHIGKIFNEFAGCWDDIPDDKTCELMKKDKFCPYPSCPLYPCWENSERGES